jgi:predicted MFS family arabinose efflux permease
MRPKTALLIVTGGLFSLLVAANLAAPLYAVYSQRYGFSSAILALIFATYALVLIPSLLAFGQLSDGLGRRPVILAGLGIGIAGLVLFAVANGVAWLFAARAVQGLSVGMISGAATAALVELEPNDDARHAALLATLAQAGGGATGPLIAGMIAQWAPDQRVLPYVAGMALTAAFALSVLAIPEPGSARGGSWRVQRPRVPAEIRAAFTRVALTAAAVWSVAALFLSVIPSYAGDILASKNLALLGAITAVMLGSSCVGQVAVRRGAPPIAAPAGGLVLLAIGLVGLVLAKPLGVIWPLVAGAAIAGLGHGVGFLATQDDLNRIAPDEHRGEVNAAFYTSIYLGVSVSAIGVGILGSAVSLFTGLSVFAAVTGTGALGVAAWHIAAGRGRAALEWRPSSHQNRRSRARAGVSAEGSR